MKSIKIEILHPNIKLTILKMILKMEIDLTVKILHPNIKLTIFKTTLKMEIDLTVEILHLNHPLEANLQFNLLPHLHKVGVAMAAAATDRDSCLPQMVITLPTNDRIKHININIFLLIALFNYHYSFLKIMFNY
jgi:hypothetical protein